MVIKGRGGYPRRTWLSKEDVFSKGRGFSHRICGRSHSLSYAKCIKSVIEEAKIQAFVISTHVIVELLSIQPWRPGEFRLLSMMQVQVSEIVEKIITEFY